MLADDLESSVNQLFYHTYAKVKEENGNLTIDLADVKKNKIDSLKDEFFISFRPGIAPKICDGGEIAFYEKHDEFNIYKIKHEKSKLMITLSSKLKG